MNETSTTLAKYCYSTYFHLNCYGCVYVFASHVPGFSFWAHYRHQRIKLTTHWVCQKDLASDSHDLTDIVGRAGSQFSAFPDSQICILSAAMSPAPHSLHWPPLNCHPVWNHKPNWTSNNCALGCCCFWKMFMLILEDPDDYWAWSKLLFVLKPLLLLGLQWLELFSTRGMKYELFSSRKELVIFLFAASVSVSLSCVLAANA